MLGLVAHDWWVFAIRGIAAIVFGILAFIWPERTLTVLVFLFGAYDSSMASRCSSRLLAATQRRGATPGPWGSWASSESSSASPPSCGQA